VPGLVQSTRLPPSFGHVFVTRATWSLRRAERGSSKGRNAGFPTKERFSARAPASISALLSESRVEHHSQAAAGLRPANTPPSMGSVVPVIHPASALAINKIASTTSSG
jgi:hypothetical protein